MTTTEPFQLAPEEAIRWFREKGYRLSYDWRDTWKEQHASAFTVAKATQLDILADIREAADKAINEGKTLAEFQRELRPLLQRKGWWGEQEQVDPVTGKTKTVQLGSARRLRTIYETNLRQAHAAGRWERVERLKTARPYLRYVSARLRTTRPEHRQWHDTVRPVDDPIWNTIAPLNGWGCKCKLQQLSERDLARYGLKVTDPPQLSYEPWHNGRTGQTMQVPRGIDPGFDYNPGKTPRGWTPPSESPALSPVRTFLDYGRPPAATVQERRSAPAAWAGIHGPADKERAHAQFDALFGVPTGKDGAVVTDPLGVGVIFNRRYLEHLLEKPGRALSAPLAKDTVSDPWEIWMVPVRLKDGTVAMRLRYIGLYTEQDHIVIAERGADGNVAWTSYPRRDVDSKRVGYLLYPKQSSTRA